MVSTFSLKVSGPAGAPLLTLKNSKTTQFKTEHTYFFTIEWIPQNQGHRFSCHSRQDACIPSLTRGALGSSSFSSLKLFVFSGITTEGTPYITFLSDEMTRARLLTLSWAVLRRKTRWIPTLALPFDFCKSCSPACSEERTVPWQQVPGQALRRRNTGSLGKVP